MSSMPPVSARVELPRREFTLWAKVRKPGPMGLYSTVVWEGITIEVGYIGPLTLDLMKHLFASVWSPGSKGVIVDGDRVYRFYGKSYRPIRDWQMRADSAFIA